MHKPFLLMTLGAMIALSTTVNTMVASIVSPVIGSITGGKGSYV